MNDYCLVALNEKPTLISFNVDGKPRFFSSLKNIDMETSKFSLDEIKKDLYEKDIIDSNDTSIVIAHRRKYNNKLYVNMYELITKDNDKYKLQDYANKDSKIKLQDAVSVIKTFYNKFKKDSFKEYASGFFSDINAHVITDFRIIYSSIVNENKSYNGNQELSYSEVRKLVCALNYYEKYPVFKDYNDRLNELGEYKQAHLQDLISITDSKKIVGQMEWDDFLDSKEETVTEKTNDLKQESVDETDEDEEDYLEIYQHIDRENWDDPSMKKYFEKGYTGGYPAEIYKMSLDDQARARIIDPLQYKYAKIDEYNKKLKEKTKKTYAENSYELKTNKNNDDLEEYDKEEFFEDDELEKMGYSDNDFKSL